jgi:hypothetical protein
MPEQETGSKKPKREYVNNEEFLKQLLAYFEACKKAKAEGKEEPPIPEYIGECFYKIAENLSFKHNFMNYSFREEMVMDGVENCLLYFRNFDPAKSENPFSYFTQIVWYAFIRRIQKENKQAYVKYKITEQAGLIDMPLMEIDDNSDIGEGDVFSRAQDPLMYTNMSEYIQNFEQKAEEKKKKRRKMKARKERIEAKALPAAKKDK